MEDKIIKVLDMWDIENKLDKIDKQDIAHQIVTEIKQPLLDIVKIDTLKLRDILIDIDYLNWNSTVIAERIADHKSQILKLKEENNG